MPEISGVRLVTSGLDFPEGPVAMDDGSIVLVEIKSGFLSRVTPDGKTERIVELGGGPNGAAIGPDGMLYVCNNGGFEWAEPLPGWWIPGHQPHDYSGGRIERVDLATGKAEVLYTECDGHPLRGPNDIVFDTSGGFWFTDHGKTRPRDRDQGGVYYATTDGSSITEAVHPADAPNGIGLSPDGTKLYYAETHTGRLFQRDVTGPGQLAEPAPLDPTILLAGLPGMNLFDSLGVDAEGNVCVATLGLTPGINSISPTGEVTYYSLGMEFFDPLTTNICWGGEDMRTAYICCSATGRLVACEWPTAGLRLNYNA